MNEPLSDNDDLIDLLKPCPFCGVTDKSNTIISEGSRHWTGMNWMVFSWEVKHWCTFERNDDSSLLKVKGRTRERAIELWNSRNG